MKDEEDSDNKDISVPQQGDVNQKEARARNLKLRRDEEDVELSVVAFVFDALRRSGLSCKGSPDDIKMDIGRPTDVRHIAHVTFDRFNGFLGLPAEFQMQIPRIAPSARYFYVYISLPSSMHIMYVTRAFYFDCLKIIFSNQNRRETDPKISIAFLKKMICYFEK